MASLMPQGKQRYTDNNGNNLAGGKLYTYAAGTSTPLATYSDQAGTTPNTNPIVLNARGEATIFWGSSPYKAVLRDASDVEIWTQDNLSAIVDYVELASTASGKGASLVGYPTTGETVTAALNARLPEIGTYALLRAYSGPTTAYYVRGVAAALDGGAGVFRVDASDTTSADDGGTILIDASARRWKREYIGAVNVKWFGAVGDGVSDDFTALTSALATGASNVVGDGTYRTSALITVPVGVTFKFNTLIPSASNISVLRQYGGSATEGTIDTSEFPAYSGIAHQFDGNGENVSAPFRLHIKTSANLVINGGGSTGTALYFKATDTNARIMGVTLNARINKFQYGVYLEQTSTDLSRFITSNYINIDTSDTLVALGMFSSHVNGYGLDGNNIVAKSQPEPSTTSVVFKLCGQDNVFDLLPWDWDTVVGTAPNAASLDAASRRNVIVWHTNSTYLNNLSTDDSNILSFPHASTVAFGKLSTTRADAVLPAPGVSLELDNNQFYKAKSSGGVSRNMIGYNSSNALAITGVNVAGSSIIFDTANATGVYAFRCNGTNRMFIDNASVTPGSDNAQTCGSASNRWSVVYAATGTINTSDGRAKDEVRPLEDVERRVAKKLKSKIKAFKFKDSIEKNGHSARIHIGVVAQEVKAAFEEEGLDPSQYALFCYDAWDEQKEQRDKEGNIIKPYIAAGDRYGIRYEELISFVIGAL